ncbi:MAG: NADH-quinone oxidoreductase subunit A [Alphaproteobacteria bacterium]|nr:NADH-quinone oxidoreductase subunit A [Alphaproteobacteria bacterium]
MGFFSLFLMIFSGLLFAVLSILVSKILVKNSTNFEKALPYECGVESLGILNFQQKIGYYFYALIFLIFEVELIFLYPWAVVAKSLGFMAFIEIMIFIFILFLGLLYAHKKNVLTWN